MPRRPKSAPSSPSPHAGKKTGTPGDGPTAPSAGQSEQTGLEGVLVAVRDATGHDFHCYKRGTLERRIRRRMALAGCGSYDEYARLLRGSPSEPAAMRQDLLIGVTEFFRQAEAWRTLEREVLAKLVEQAEAGATLRVWVPACASGKEAYSLAMLLAETVEASGKKLGLQVFATDADASAVEVARAGRYTEEDLKGVSPERLARFFTPKGGRFEVAKSLREQIVFAPQDLTADPPFSKLDLVSCRSVLIYLEQAVQKRVIQLFHFALRDGGCLFLGSAETVGGQESLFEPISRKWRIYRKLHAPTPLGLEMPMRPAGRPVPHLATPTGSRTTLPAVAHQAIAERFGPPGAIVDRRGTLLFLHGDVGDYLRMPEGEQTHLLADAAKEGLRNRLTSALLQAVSQNRLVAVQARVKKGRRSLPVKVTVSPLARPREADGLLLVTFEPQGPARLADAAADIAAQDHDVHQLEHELAVTRDELSTTITRLEQSNADLKASNEEVMSANEELQSANEEMETSKEELHSLNEELNAVNLRLQEKVAELEQAGNDVANLMASGNIATVFLDRRLRVRRYTPAVTRLLSLIPGDLGRPITDVVRRFRDDRLVEDARGVLQDLAPASAEVQADDGEWYLRHVLPYRTQDDRIEGVVVTFHEVTELKELTKALGASEEQALWLARFPSENPNPVVRASADGTVLYRNAAAARNRGWQCEVGQPLAHDALRRLVGKAFADGESFEQDVELDGLYYAVAVSPILAECYANLYGRDITSRVRTEESLRHTQEQNQFLADILQRSSQPFAVGYPDGRIGLVNEAFEKLTGYSAEELRQIDWSKVLTPPEWLPLEREKLAELHRTRRPVRYEKQYIRKDGSRVPIELLVDLGTDSAGKPSHYCSFLIDITDRKQAEQALRQSEQSVRRKLQGVLDPQSDLGTLELGDLIDSEPLQDLMDDFYAVAHIPMSIMDSRGRMLVGVGWQDICLKFHRAQESTALHCLESDTQLSAGLGPGESRLYRCKNNLWDMATPIFVAGQCVGNVFSGQFFFDDEVVDRESFRAQARRYGFDEEQYLDSLDRVPRLSRQIVDRGMAFFRKLADTLSQVGYSNLKLARLLAERDRLTESLRDSRQRLQRAQEIARLGSWEMDLADNSLTWSDETYRIFGLTPQQFEATYEAFLDRVHPDDRPAVADAYESSIRERRDTYETEHRVVCADTGEIRWVHEKCQHVRDDEGRLVRSIGMVLDITERQAAEQALRELNETLEQRVAERTAEVRDLADRLRALAADLAATEQRERKRLAMILHDHIQQPIVASRMQLSWVSRNEDPQRRAAVSQGIDAILREALQASRDLTVDLSPPLLHDAGLIGGLNWLAGRMKDKHQLTVDLRADSQAEPAREETRLLLFECARELLFNIVKHAGVGQAEVSLLRTPEGDVQLVVWDDGAGFDPAGLSRRDPSEDAFGLFSIQQRLAHIGGHMAIRSAPGKGTTVTLAIPDPQGALD